MSAAKSGTVSGLLLDPSRLTVLNTASNAFPIASVTFFFFSFSLSSMGSIKTLLYLPNPLFCTPNANPCVTLAAFITTLTFTSVIRLASA
jgi:hypothetical protein